MKINLVLPHQLAFPPILGGGVENLNWLLAQEFARLGHEVVAYSRRVQNLSAWERGEFGIQHVRVTGYDRHPNRWLDHANGLRYARTLSSVLQAADVTSFHTPFSFLLARKSGLGVCAHTIHRTPKWPVPFYRRLDRVYCGSDAVVQQARKVDTRIRNLKRIYNCIAVANTPPAGFVRSSKSGLTFLYIGRFVPDKGIASLVEGFEISLRKNPANSLRTVGPQVSAAGGNSAFFKKMLDYLSRRGLSKRISFLKPIFEKERLSAMIMEADVICVPSLSGETFSMAILEAMALGKPVLVSDFSPMPEAVDHEITGYVARAGDAESIAEGIRFFSDHAEELPRLGRAGFEKARQCFSVERIAGEYLEDFSGLVAQKKCSPGVLQRCLKRYELLVGCEK